MGRFRNLMVRLAYAIVGCIALVPGVIIGMGVLSLKNAPVIPPNRVDCRNFDKTAQIESHIRGGEFYFGSDSHYPEEAPARLAKVKSFWIDRTEVTNAQFSAFVSATGYVTHAERGLSESEASGLPIEFRAPGSMVFEPPSTLEGASPIDWW